MASLNTNALLSIGNPAKTAGKPQPHAHGKTDDANFANILASDVSGKTAKADKSAKADAAAQPAHAEHKRDIKEARNKPDAKTERKANAEQKSDGKSAGREIQTGDTTHKDIRKTEASDKAEDETAAADEAATLPQDAVAEMSAPIPAPQPPQAMMANLQAQQALQTGEAGDDTASAEDNKVGEAGGAKNAAALAAPQPADSGSTNDTDGATDAKPQTAAAPQAHKPTQAAQKPQARETAKNETPGEPSHATGAQADAAPAQPAPQPAPAGGNTNAIPNISGVTASVAPPPGGAPVAANTNVNVQVSPQHTPPDVDGLAVQIASRTQSGARQFQIRLDPPELGQVEVRLSIDAAGKAEAHLTADQPQALHLLQKDSESLTRALRDAGLDFSQGSLNFSLKGQDRHDGDSAPQPRTPFQTLTATKTIEAAGVTNAYLSSAGDARLDIHV